MNKILRYLLLYLGGALIAGGVVLIYEGWYGLSFPIPCPNVPNGCPWTSLYWTEVYIGLAMTLIGTGMVIASRLIREHREEKTLEAKTSPGTGA